MCTTILLCFVILFQNNNENIKLFVLMIALSLSGVFFFLTGILEHWLIIQRWCYPGKFIIKFIATQ
jgi:hypothetical protein